MSLPFDQSRVSEDSFIRKFSSSVEADELYWHKDKCDRIVRVIAGEGWMYQEENSLPVELFPGFIFSIKKGTWHRVIRGSSDLSVLIKEAV